MVPQASVIMPTRGRATIASQAIASIAGLSAANRPFEVLVVDTGSAQQDQCFDYGKLNAFGDKRFRYIAEPTPSLVAGRHRGAWEARSDLLLFIDDDVVLDPSWLSAIIETFEDRSVHLVGARVLPLYEMTQPAWLDAFWHRPPEGPSWCASLSLVDFGDELREVSPDFVWGVSFAIRRETLWRLGGFHPDGVPWELRRYRGDGESALSRAVAAAGLRTVYQPKAVVRHLVPRERLTIEYFQRRAFLQGVSDSYTAIRRSGGIDDVPHGAPESAARDCLTPVRRARRLGGRIKRLVLGFVQRCRLVACESNVHPEPFAEVKKIVDDAYRGGFSYHQREVRNDAELLEWVLRKDYWDYRYPKSAKAFFLDLPDEALECSHD